MRLDGLLVHNVGPYRGEHIVDLSVEPDRPVVLFGGLNGAGKTTLLEAIQLSLYGSQCEPARRSGLAYDEYLSRATNRSSPGSEGAAVGVTFTVHESGEPRTYRVRRTWKLSRRGAKKVRESLDVWVEGTADPALAEAWPEQVAQFLPPRLAPLFFFDGERIEQLADPEQSAEALRTAVGALLGADLVDRLGADLEVLLRRRRVEQVIETNPAMAEADRALTDAKEERRLTLVRRAAAVTATERAEELYRRADRTYAEQGGRAAEERKRNESVRAATLAERQGLEREMRTLVAGTLPLVLVRPLLESARARARAQSTASDRQVATAVLREGGERLLAELREKKTAAKTLAHVQSWVERESTLTNEGGGTPFSDARAAADRLDQLLDETLHRERERAGVLRREHVDTTARLETIDRALAMTPDEDAVREATEVREAALVELAGQQALLAQAIEEEEKAGRKVVHCAGELDRLLESDRAVRGEAADGVRFARHAEVVQTVLKRFGARLRARHLQRLEKLVLECYRALMRKQSLATGLSIDPVTCNLCLTDSGGVEVRAERLSAGERQLLAVAMLWAMGRASSRSLPIAVDTPLGRLDGTHRQRLVERYFPKAAAQVLLFSTDEEVDAELYASLKPHVGRAYRLEHDEQGGTSVSAGYPFASDADEKSPVSLATPTRTWPSADSQRQAAGVTT